LIGDDFEVTVYYLDLIGFTEVHCEYGKQQLNIYQPHRSSDDGITVLLLERYGTIKLIHCSSEPMFIQLITHPFEYSTPPR